jgi:PTS system mannose-specific IID component
VITPLTKLKVLAGSFFLQASWSFERMQGLGFAAAISPALKELYAADEEKMREALKRHLVFYNAHPYMASPVLGACVRLEERARDGEAAVDSAARFKKLITGAYGAIGDSFFWGSVRPLASIIGIIATILWGVWGPLVFLVLYNLVHLWTRFRGLQKGLELGDGVVSYIKSLGLPRWAERGRRVCAALLGVLAAVFAVMLAPSLTGHPGGVGTAAVAITAVVALSLLQGVLQSRGVRISTLVYITLPPLLIYGLVAG